MQWDFEVGRLGQQKNRWRLLALLGLLVGFALRLYRLGATSLWYDETVSVALAQKSIPALIQHTAGDIHPPGYYLLLHFWQALTQPTPTLGLEFLYAWPSLWCGLLIVALLFALGRRLASPSAALVGLWLAAINPYQIWYSQEVRMYTLGALLGLVGLWALLRWWQRETTRKGPYGWLVVYVLAGAAGLYTLYYFLFVLVALNAIALLFWFTAWRQTATRQWLLWMMAQIALLLLWLPWLPVFWRQAIEPPVPPWRISWTMGAELLDDLARGASALISGQSTPAPTGWFWLLLFSVILLLALLHYTNKTKAPLPIGYIILVGYLLIPLAALVTITLWITPLYHVRYLFTYAPPFLLLLAAALLACINRQSVLGAVATIGLLVVHGWSLYNFWVAPPLQDDDHRDAVAQLAQAWRPGDVILVNAGWVYTALTTYWPTTLVGPDAAAPPPLDQIVRLLDYPTLAQQAPAIVNPTKPVVVRTGSVDGAPTLGWGDPASDFFAISAADTNLALFAVARQSQRLWHYRLYDTVNDPAGVIRNWFDTYNIPLHETPIPGRDYLRIQLYQSGQAAPDQAWAILPLQQDRFVGDLHLQEAALISPTVVAGSYLYAKLTWQPPLNRATLPTIISFSLRLYNTDGQLLAQADETPTIPLSAWPTPYPYHMALPIPVATPPGVHNLVLIAYDAQSGVPLAVAATAPQQQELSLGTIQITPATAAPIIPTVTAGFDYIDLVRARITTPTAAPGSPLAVELVWRPQANDYRDTYLGQLTLTNEAGDGVGQWETALGGWQYPSGTWPPLIPVRDWRTLPLDPATPPGRYTLTLRVLRDSDKQIVPARQQWWSRGEEALVIGTVEIR